MLGVLPAPGGGQPSKQETRQGCRGALSSRRAAGPQPSRTHAWFRPGTGAAVQRSRDLLQTQSQSRGASCLAWNPGLDAHLAGLGHFGDGHDQSIPQPLQELRILSIQTIQVGSEPHTHLVHISAVEDPPPIKAETLQPAAWHTGRLTHMHVHTHAHTYPPPHSDFSASAQLCTNNTN